MPQIFISYSRAERQVASALAERLSKAGFDVWWDASLVGGDRFEDEINQALRDAAVAIVLWSRSAAKSDWVRAEAEVARRQKSAIPVVIDDVSHEDLPLLFQSIHTIDMRDWTGDVAAPGYRHLLDAVAERSVLPGAPPETVRRDIGSTPIVPAPARNTPWFRRRLIWAAMAILVIVVALAAMAIVPRLPSGIVPNCSLRDAVKSPAVPLAICVNADDWRLSSAVGSSFNYYMSDADFLFRSSTIVATPDEELQRLLDEAAAQPGFTETPTVSQTTYSVLSGRTWQRWTFIAPVQFGQPLVYVAYFYSAPGFGTAELIFTGSAERRVVDLANRVVQSVTYLN